MYTLTGSVPGQMECLQRMHVRERTIARSIGDYNVVLWGVALLALCGALSSNNVFCGYLHGINDAIKVTLFDVIKLSLRGLPIEGTKKITFLSLLWRHWTKLGYYSRIKLRQSDAFQKQMAVLQAELQATKGLIQAGRYGGGGEITSPIPCSMRLDVPKFLGTDPDR
ncbi:hypothetical protein Tco_1025654 [Tanacetum coccineum]